MLYREIFRILGNYLYYFSLIICFPFAVAFYYEFVADPKDNFQPHGTFDFLLTIFLSLFIATIFRFLGKKAKGKIFRRESILLVFLIWIFTSLISAFPFYLSKTLPDPIDSYFEAMSGLTTTGATLIAAKKFDAQTKKEIPIVVTNSFIPDKSYSYYGTTMPIKNPNTNEVLEGVESVGKAMLLWRSFLQWIGGMGIVVLFLTVLPALGVGGKLLYQTEVTGPVKEAVAPRIKETASLLWKLYFVLTILEIFLLMWTNENMPLYDAVCVTFSNLSTGGFSVRNNSIASYHSAATEWIVILFMLLGSINFGLYFHIIRLKFYRIYVPDFFLFLIIVLASSLIISFYITGTPSSQLYDHSGNYSYSEAFRTAFFQASSAQTSTGFVTANYDVWPFPAQMFMLIIMFIGGMSGSTCGGIKTSRFYLLYKSLTHRIEALFRPEAIRKLKFGDTEIDFPSLTLVLAFFCVVAFFTVLGTVLFIIDGIDPETSLGLITCFMNNIGIAFRAAGPDGSMNFLSPFSKIISIFWMLLGRLEFFVLLLLFFPGFWKGK